MAIKFCLPSRGSVIPYYNLINNSFSTFCFSRRSDRSAILSFLHLSFSLDYEATPIVKMMNQFVMLFDISIPDSCFHIHSLESSPIMYQDNATCIS
jgi:hypothetical protein